MEYQATAKYIHISTRKIRLVADACAKKSVAQALVALASMEKQAAKPLRTLILSAVAGAKQKNAKTDTLLIQSIIVMGGPVMKRFHAVSRGMAHAYKKRMTHIQVILTEPKEKHVIKKKKEIKE